MKASMVLNNWWNKSIFKSLWQTTIGKFYYALFVFGVAFMILGLDMLVFIILGVMFTISSISTTMYYKSRSRF